VSEKKPSLLILSATREGVKAPETYLKNRGWEIYGTTKLKEMIAIMASRRPQFVMVAADHGHKKIPVILTLVKQAFGAKVIGFSEKVTNHALGALADLPIIHKLQPPVSGPAVERMVAKMLREEAIAKERSDKERERLISEGHDPEIVMKAVADANGNIVIGGPNMGNAGGTESDVQQAQSMLAQLLSTGGSEQEKPAAAGMYIAKGQQQNPQSNYNAQVGQEQNSGNINQQGASIAAGLAARGGAGNSNDGGNINQQGPSVAAGLAARGGAGNSNDGGNINQQGPSVAAGLAARGGGSSNQTGGGYNPGFGQSTQNPKGVMQKGMGAGKSQRSNQQQPNDSETDDVIRFKSQVVSSNSESIILKGTQEALDQSVVVEENVILGNEVKDTKNVACIVVNSERFKGYMLAAWGANRQLDDDFMSVVREKIFNFMREHGETVDDKTSLSMELKIETVDFGGWAGSQADFLCKSIHGADQIAMAFFPAEDIHGKTGASAKENMMSLNFKDIREDTPVEFDCYIYMAANDKYVLYTKEGGAISGEQKGRLTTRGVGEIHLSKDSGRKLTKYKAQNFLNDKIASYKDIKAKTG
jgi:hypothetical protein